MRSCYICGSTNWIERHHVFNGPFRKKSEKYDAVVDLCHYCHNEPPNGVHFDQELDNELKSHFQELIMEREGWDTQRFIFEFGRNYIA